LSFKTKEKIMFVYPTSKGHHVLDAELAIPHASVPTVNTPLEDIELEEESHKDPFMQFLDEEEELYNDDFLGFYSGHHVHDNQVSSE